MDTTPSPTKEDGSPTQQLKPKKLNLDEAMLSPDTKQKDLNRISEVNQSEEEEKNGLPQSSM
jgi:hypothetical protein